VIALTSNFDPRGKGCVFVAAAIVLVGAAALGVLTAYVAYARRIPADSPLARMYRTEADLAALAKAVDAYRAAYGAYPDAGQEGLRKACAALSEIANYLPDGPPLDGWNRPFHYAPVAEQDAYRLHSAGALDSESGFIVHGDPEKSWRPHYRALQREFMKAPSKEPLRLR